MSGILDYDHSRFAGMKVTVLPVPLASELDEFKHSEVGKRVHAWTWQSFPVGMGTAAAYLCLANLHDKSRRVMDVAQGLYYLSIAIFLFNVAVLLVQLLIYPKRARRLIHDPVIGTFVPVFCLLYGTIVMGTVDFAVPAGRVSAEFVYRIFWVYVALATLVSVGMCLVWFNSPHRLSEFTPVDAFLIYPLMLVGLIGGVVLNALGPDDTKALGVLFVSLFCQGLGFIFSLFFLALYVTRLYIGGLLTGPLANGAFIACGPPGFTASALILLGGHARTLLPNHGLISPIAGEVWYAVSVLDALMLEGLAVLFFLLAALPYWFKLKKDLHQILGCWAVTFPNSGWITGIKLLGDALNIPGFYVVHDILTTAMCIAWLVLIFCTGLAFFRKEIFYEGDAITKSGGAGSTGMGGRQTAEVREAASAMSEKREERGRNIDLEAAHGTGRGMKSVGRVRTMGASFEEPPPAPGLAVSADLDPIAENGDGKGSASPGGHDRQATGLSKRTLVASESS